MITFSSADQKNFKTVCPPITAPEQEKKKIDLVGRKIWFMFLYYYTKIEIKFNL